LRCAFDHGHRDSLKPSTRVCGRVPLGAPARLSCADEGARSGLAGAVNSEVIKSKLYRIEASAVHRQLTQLIHMSAAVS
jgi:hypothetical protein